LFINSNLYLFFKLLYKFILNNFLKFQREQKFTKPAFFYHMQNLFIKKDRIEKTYEKVNLDDNSLEDKFFKGCREVTIDSELYKSMSNKEEYDKLGNTIEENYLRNVRKKLLKKFKN
jgi:hypothetical protein